MGVTATREAGPRARFDALDLAPGVHAAIADRRLVILDLRRDRYFRLSRRQSEAVEEWRGAMEADEALRRRLAAKGLCRVAPDVGESVYRSSVSSPSLSAMRALGVLGACLWADRTLKTRPLADTLRAVARPKRSGDAVARAEAVRAFLSHRPFYPRDYACLFEALALLRYLARRGHFATWVFGVRGAPFSAHCWLEADGEPLNDDPDAVAAFVPILAV